MPKGMQPIYTQTVGSGGVASITFNNIPQTYNDLKIFMSVRVSSTGGAFATGGVQINGDSSVSYSRTYAQAYGSGAYSGRDTGGSSGLLVDGMPTNSATSNTFSNIEMTIPNYKEARYKSILLDSVGENNSTSDSNVLLVAGLYRAFSPVKSITIFVTPGFTQHSTFTLYGISR